MQILTVIFALFVAVHGALHGHGEVHKRAHALVNRAVEVNIVTITEVVTVTVEASADATSSAAMSVVAVELTSTSSFPIAVLTSASSARAPTNPSQSAPTTIANPTPISVIGKDTNPYQPLTPTPKSAIIKNSCTYPVYIWSAGDPSCPQSPAQAQLLAASSTYTEPLRKCPSGGVSLKVSKSNSAAKPMQFEYAIWADEQTVSYDISYLDCMENDLGQKDLSDCAGHDGGIQALGGGDCKRYFCEANQWCDQQAYVVAEFGYQPGAPVGGCAVDKGIAFELCAGNRK